MEWRIRAEIREIKRFYDREIRSPFIIGSQGASGAGLADTGDRSLEILEALSARPFYPATLLLGFCSLYSIKVKQDHAQAFGYFQKATEQSCEHKKCAVALCQMAECFYYGYGTEKAEQEAVKWYLESAALHYSQAQYNLGYCYFYGKGVDKNIALGQHYYGLSSAQNNPFGQNSNGYCHELGYGVQKDAQKANQLYEAAANQGYLPAMFNYARNLSRGSGVEQNVQKAIYYFKMAAELGHAAAKQELDELVKVQGLMQA